MIAVEGLLTVPEFERRNAALSAARDALRANNFAEARRLCAEADRYAHLARVRISARLERTE